MSNSAFQITLPKSWPTKVRSAMLHVVSLAKYAAVYTRSWAADSHCQNAARQSDRVLHAQSGENSHGKVQNVVVNNSTERHTAIDEACRAILRETLRCTFKWACQQVEQHQRNPDDVTSQLGLAFT